MENTNKDDRCCAGVGVWNRYVPLSNLIQVGTIGILDSNCFQLFRIQDKTNNELHFIHYQCVDYENKTIKKYFLFLDKEVGDIKEEILVDYNQYEFIWYFNGFFTNPSNQEVIIYQLDGMNQLYQKPIQYKFQIDQQKFEQIVGGDFIVPQNIPLQHFERNILSYFPGDIKYIEGCYIFSPQGFISLIKQNSNKACYCYQSSISSIADVRIEKQNFYEFVSNNLNCQEFLLQGWVKIQEIHSYDAEFDYQLLKLAGNFQNSHLIQKNLCAFQLFYKISSSKNQIIITTYSYTIPAVYIDFSNNPFLKSETIDVTFDIKLWHYVLVTKLENSIQVSITFYKGFDKEEFNINLDVQQFHKIQFKLLYGNLLQSTSNYLTIQIFDFQFLNCLYSNQPQISCHPICKQCDGPTKDDCLSCFEDSNRRYLPEFKQCICEYGKVDENNNCVDYKVLNLNLNQVKPLKEECKYGFFEIEGYCQQCPSIINKNVITCLECVQNPKKWAQTLTCQTTLYTNKEGNTSQKLQDQQQQFIFLGNDLQYCPDCYTLVTPSYDQVKKSINLKIFVDQQMKIATLVDRIVMNVKSYKQIQIAQPIFTNPVLLKKNLVNLRNIKIFKKIVQTVKQKIVYIASIILEVIQQELLQALQKIILLLIKKFKMEVTLLLMKKLQKAVLNVLKNTSIILQLESKFALFLLLMTLILLLQSQIVNLIFFIVNSASKLHNLLLDAYFVRINICYLPQQELALLAIMNFPNNVLKSSVQILGNGQFKALYINFYLINLLLIINYRDQKLLSLNACQVIKRQKEAVVNIAIRRVLNAKIMAKSLNVSNANKIIIKRQQEINLMDSVFNVEEIIVFNLIKQKINPYFVITPDSTIYTYRCLQQIPLEKIQIDPNLQIAQYCYLNNCDNNLELYNNNVDCNYIQLIPEDQLNQLNYQYFNNIGLKELAITIQLADDCNLSNPDHTLTNDFKENIFSLQIARFKYQGTKSPIQTEQSYALKIYNYDVILLTNIKFIISSNLNLIFQNRGNPIDVTFIDISFSQAESNAISFSIQGDRFLNLSVKNLLIFDCRIENSVVFNIYCADLSDTIKIENFKLQNCKFTNSALFQFQNVQRTILIKNFIIDSCEFYNSTIVLFQLNQNPFSNIIYNDVQIANTLFQNTSFIYSNERTKFTINNLSIIKSKMMNSKFIIFNYESKLKNILIKDSDLISFQFISQISSIMEEYEIQLDQIQFQKNTIYNSQIFVTEYKQSITQTKLLFNNLYFEDNIMASQQEQYLIIINCFNLTIQNTFIRNTLNYRFISLIAVPFIKIEHLIYEISNQKQKVKPSSECLQNQIYYSQLLQVSGFIDITLNFFQLKNLFSIDQSIISIQSNPLNMLNSNENIKIKNFLVKGNILIKQQLGKLFSIIELQSEKPQIIELDQLSFEENIFHEYNKDPSQTSASLFYLDSGLGLLMMKNIICSNNSLTNSSLSYISIFSKEIQVENFYVQNHNYHSQEFWVKYYEIQFQGNYNQNEITYIISQSYNIVTLGGVLSTTVTKFSFNNGLFSYIKAQGSQVFNINLQGVGIVIIQNCIVNHAHNSLFTTLEQNGAFTISAKKSLLTLYLNNVILTDVLNKQSSSIFQIDPSYSKNNIELKNIVARDCFSLIDQILSFKFDSQIVLQNNVKIDNFTIIQTQAAFLTFVQSFGKVGLVEREKMLTDNAIMNLVGCTFTLDKFNIYGIILSSIIKLMDSKYIKITNSKFTNIQTFYPLNLVDVQQSNDMQSKILFFIIFQYKILLILNLVTQINGLTRCQFGINLFKEIVSNSNQNGSLIKLKTITNQTQVLFKTIMLLNNDCQNCLNGLLYFEQVDFQKALISELSCIMNSNKNYGCILAKSDKKIDSITSIQNSMFISNKGQLGAGIFIQNQKFYLKNSILLNNIATQIGGGFYFSEGSQRFTINNSLIFNNQAAEAGGIFLFGNSSLTKNNFIKSLVLLNFASISSNNINELPQHLSLQINLIEMFSQQKLIENHQYQVLYLKPYKIISQDHSKQTNDLFLPSGQKLQAYELYNPKHQKYQSFIFDLSILFKNSMNEVLINFENSTCNVQLQIFDNAENLSQSIKMSKLNFNQNTKGFNLDSLQFDIDPYKQENKIQEILVYCNTSYQDEQLAYRMRVNSFLCQLGEFYIYSGCQTCQPLQGFQSVTYNTTKYSIFDKNKFDAITSNKIKLKAGFWRPNQISDYIELCFKNPTYCEGGWKFGNDLCSQGHIGGLCEECDRYDIRGAGSFFKDQKQLECKQCQEFQRLLLTFFLISIWAILSTLLTIRSIEKSNSLFASLKLRQKFVEILFKLNQDHESILLKLFLNYLWIFSLIFTFNIRLSFSLNFLKQSSDTSYFMANYFECILAEIQGIELIYSRILVMFVLLFAQILIIFIGFNILSILTKTKVRMRIISITFLYLYIQNYASLINQFFSILAVRKISNQDYISGDVSLIYGSETHVLWIKEFAIPGSTLIGLIIPLLLFLMLYLNRENHNKIKFRRHVGYLFNEYTQQNYFWEMIKLWKKTIIIVILIYFETDIFLKAALLGLCLLFYQFIAQNYKPFILQKFNSLDIQSGQYCSFAIFFGVIKYICEQSEQYNFSTLIQSFIFITSILLSYPFINNILKVYYNKYRLLVLASLFQGFKSLNPNFKFTKFLGEIISNLRQKEYRIQKNIQKLRALLLKKKQDGQLGIINLAENNMKRKKQISLILNCSFRNKI
ncbi:unnamed protein product [Paramecium octaurelia]|uniref:Transmembrane protein n=1 Tax=Paramecium octaurelia TaxID=43137 RepID=A0A8S1SEW3_PAROT|nr:unnamed protein product [Paramecium octaurelia]